MFRTAITRVVRNVRHMSDQNLTRQDRIEGVYKAWERRQIELKKKLGDESIADEVRTKHTEELKALQKLEADHEHHDNGYKNGQAVS